MGDENPIRTLGDYSRPSHKGYWNTIELPEGNNVIFYDHVSFHLKCEIERAFGGKLCNKNADESWEIIKNLALYDHEGWTMMTPGNAENPTETKTETPVMEVEEINEVKSGAKIIKTSENDEAVEAPGSQPEDIEGNFKIPCSIGNLNRMSALIDQGSNVNVMPYSTYMRFTDEKPAKTDIRLSLGSHSYIYPLGIAEDVLVKIAEHVYPVDFVILDIRENENRPFILGTPFLTTAKASIKFDTRTITLKSGNHKVSFHRKPDSSNMIDKGVKNDIEPIAPTMTVNRVVREWEEKIKLYLEREMQFNQWKSKNFKHMHPTLIATKKKKMMDNKGEVT
nr:hypothetical protein [Tanacetum cinerariifolium]